MNPYKLQQSIEHVPDILIGMLLRQKLNIHLIGLV